MRTLRGPAAPDNKTPPRGGGLGNTIAGAKDVRSDTIEDRLEVPPALKPGDYGARPREARALPDSHGYVPAIIWAR